jgi:hydrogenase maturation protease
MSTASDKTVVLGLGNILHGDDGAGAQAISRLRADPRVSADVSLVEGGTLGLELLPYVWDCARLIVIDAIEVGEPPGTLVRMSGEDLNSLPGHSNVHQLGVSDLLVALRMLADRQPEVVLLGVQPGSTDWSCELSSHVAATIDSLVEAAIRELHQQAHPELHSTQVGFKRVM